MVACVETEMNVMMNKFESLLRDVLRDWMFKCCLAWLQNGSEKYKYKSILHLIFDAGQQNEDMLEQRDRKG